YNCPHTFCFDGANLLILRFRARSQAEIPTCQVDCWVIPTVSAQGTASIQYAFYRLLSDGFYGAVGRHNVNTGVKFGNWRRYFDWYNGKPYWSDGNSTVREVPGCNRVFHSGARRWAWDGNNEAHQSWDTGAF
ncbi:hypothetical protein EJ02DRAFT_355462, partial [Clathrospora elynae]